MELSDVFDYLSTDQHMSRFLALFDAGVRDEWDTGIEEALRLFGGGELGLAARAAASSARWWEARNWQPEQAGD